MTYEHTEEQSFYDTVDELPPSSPFVENVDITLRSPQKLQSPTKPTILSTVKTIETSDDETQTQLRENEGLTTAIVEMEEAGSQKILVVETETLNEVQHNFDETCYSDFSVVPCIPDMTTFAGIGSSPTRTSPIKHHIDTKTPISSRPNTPGTARTAFTHQVSPSPTPRKVGTPLDETTRLMDFTEQMNFASQYAYRGNPSSPSRLKNALSQARSPVKDPFGAKTLSGNRMLNLIDLDFTQVTPKSMPATISNRELENMKAEFLSEISSLKATLSGKDTEIRSLQVAKDDAEKRVGKMSEELRESRSTNEELLADKSEGERRDRETQEILRDIKSELLQGERDRQELSAQIEESERRREEAELRASDAEGRLASSTTEGSAPKDDCAQTPGAGSNKDIETAVANVAKELHALYKSKHEAKVAALRKSYETRWGKKISELETKIEGLTRENEDLKLGRDATMTKVSPSIVVNEDGSQRSDANADAQSIVEEKEAASKALEELGAKLEALKKEVIGLQVDKAQLSNDLSVSRNENSDLVAAVEQMLVLESSAPPAPSSVVSEPQPPQPPAQTSTSAECSLARLTGKPSGLRGPGFKLGGGESKIGMMKPRAGGFGGAKSGMMRNIETMGRGRMAD